MVNDLSRLKLESFES